MIFKKDNFVFGLVLGFIAPFFGFILYKFLKYRAFTIGEMLQWLKLNPNLITVFISISLFANAVLFTIYINGHKDKTAKGIFVLTIVYAVVAMLFKYL
jgi:NADH:ubiquinone oxidoreductase subunit K